MPSRNRWLATRVLVHRSPVPVRAVLPGEDVGDGGVVVVLGEPADQLGGVAGGGAVVAAPGLFIWMVPVLVAPPCQMMVTSAIRRVSQR